MEVPPRQRRDSLRSTMGKAIRTRAKGCVRWWDPALEGKKGDKSAAVIVGRFPRCVCTQSGASRFRQKLWTVDRALRWGLRLGNLGRRAHGCDWREGLCRGSCRKRTCACHVIEKLLASGAKDCTESSRATTTVLISAARIGKKVEEPRRSSFSNHSRTQAAKSTSNSAQIIGPRKTAWCAASLTPR